MPHSFDNGRLYQGLLNGAALDGLIKTHPKDSEVANRMDKVREGVTVPGFLFYRLLFSFT